MDTTFLGLKQREKALNVKKSHNNFFLHLMLFYLKCLVTTNFK